MDIQFPSLVSLFLFFSTLIFFKFKSKNSTRNLPPGPWKLPLIGNLHNLMGALPHRALHQLALKHGPLMHLQLGELSAVIVSSPETAKEVMKTHDLNFASRPPILAAEIMGYGCTNITFGPYGDHWRQLRKICTLELLSVKRVKSFRALREQVCSDLARWIASMEGTAVNLTEKVYASTYAFTATAALGKMRKEREDLLPLIKESIGLGAGFDIAELYPSITLFRMMSRVRRRLSELHEEADKIFQKIIDDHKVADSVKNGDESDKQEDLVDVLLKFQDDGLDISLTDNNIKTVILDVLAAGSETSSTTVDWAMAEMLKNPGIMKRAQDEVRHLFDEKGHVDESLIHELPYLKSVVKETLRMHPPLPLLLPRKCGDTCQINGYEIAENTKIIVNAWAINRDPKYWKDGECFQPQRFIDDEVVDYKGSHFEYIPFGAGRRQCPGISFGIANVELPLAMLLYHFDWSLPAGEKTTLDMEEGWGVTAARIQDLCVVPLIITRPLP
uniref:Cytochrome P450 CYP71D1 n=1 Tax=Scutellaria baicalensis TaxID=65409 RepID=A0A286RS63_SCUBA|nr:cytochrome P450 CYP71D1 [Scutellaria baicalensis]